ncbi:hypothetical protein YYE_03445 [Plasmodium vinckei vinckei]|nr:hypothetical protein YYE_03445 [Plasmodium vinckei vinckei]
MIHLKNKCFHGRLWLKCKGPIHIYKKNNLYFYNYVNFLNKSFLRKEINSMYFSTSNNLDYINYINEINNYIETFQKQSDNSISNEGNILPILQKIKNETKYNENEEIMEIISSIKLLIEKRVRPIVVNDGGDIKFVCFDMDTGIVYVQLQGACVGCSQSEVTLQYMIKNMLTYYISEIKEIKNISKDGIIL